MIAAIVSSGTYLDIDDINGDEVVNGIFAAAIEKAGALIDILSTHRNVSNYVRMLANAKNVSFHFCKMPG